MWYYPIHLLCIYVFTPSIAGDIGACNPNLQGLVVKMLDSTIHQAPVVQKVDNAILRINLYPLDSAIGFNNTYLLDSDLSGG